MVGGVTPNGSVAWFGVAREISSLAATIVRRTGTADANSAGRASIELDAPLPWQAIWVAVDTETGRFGVAADPEFELRRMRLDSRALQLGAHGIGDLPGHEFVEVFLVRPTKGRRAGGGVWAGTVGDGGASDEDGRADGKVAVDLARLVVVEDSPPLTSPVFEAGDVIAIVDPNAMTIEVAVLEPEPGL